jgi:uncharacterized phage infection (PIP) family protein YhgE
VAIDMGLFSRRDPDASEARIARLETHLNTLQTYLEEVAKAEAETATVSTPAPSTPTALAAPGSDQAPDPSLPPHPPRIIDAEMVEQALAELTTRMDALAAGITQMDARLSSISTEIANQLSELGNEIDALSQGLGDEETVTNLKSAQTRLAQEQARYQIAFQQDLAELAERIKPAR